MWAEDGVHQVADVFDLDGRMRAAVDTVDLHTAGARLDGEALVPAWKQIILMVRRGSPK